MPQSTTIKILKRGFVAKHRWLNHNIPRLTGRAWQKSSSQTPSAPTRRLTLNSVLLSTSTGPLCLLQVLITPAVRFMSGPILRSPCCIFSTVIHGYVLSSQAVHMHSQWILVTSSGYGESALDRVYIVCTLTIRVNSSHLLQNFPWNLAQPVHPVITEGESEAAEESQGLTRLHKSSPRLHQLHLKLDTCKYSELWSGTGTCIHWSSHSCPLIHSVSHVLHKSPLKVAQEKSSSVPTPW
jgi:hypothetical protein